MKAQWIAATTMAAVLLLAGCDGTGGLGGQGINITVNIHEKAHDNSVDTDININDGGTAVASDPLASKPQATTMPVASDQ